MKKFYPTYLYIKTHNITGLKYFGKTTGNPEKYQGSGKYWLNHLKIHGNDVSTKILGFFESKDECINAATKFSTDNNIINSVNKEGKKSWANQINENGLDGGNTGRTIYNLHSEETKRKISESNKGKLPWNTGKTGVTSGNRTPRTAEQKEKISKSLTGRSRSVDAVKKTADKLRGRKRPEISRALTGIKRTPETIEKMKLSQQNRNPVTEETKQKIREKRKLQIFTDETKQKLKGKIVCISKIGEIKKIDKELFYSQVGLDEQREWVFHRSREGLNRKLTESK